MPSTTCCTTSRNGDRGPALKDLLLDAPQMMGVESIELDTVNLRMVARTLPGKQYEVGRRIRVLVVRALRRAGIVSAATETPRWSPRSRIRRRVGRRGRRRSAHRSRSSDLLVQGEARPHPGVDGGARRRVHRAVLGAADLPAGTGPRSARSCRRPARFRARPELRLGAATNVGGRRSR